MKATIQNIIKNNNDFQFPQIDVEVLYEDVRFPEGERRFIFTLPPEKYSEMTEGELSDMVKEQGKAFDKVLTDNETMVTKEQSLQTLVGTQITI